MDRYVQFAVAAAMEAMRDSGLDLEAVDRERMGVTLGTAVGGTMFLEDEYVAVSNNGRGVARRPGVRARRSSTRRSCRAAWRARWR